MLNVWVLYILLSENSDKYETLGPTLLLSFG